MFHKLPKIIRGIIIGFIFITNALITSVTLFIVAFIKFIMPTKKCRAHVDHFLNRVPEYWTDVNAWLLDTFCDISWDIQGIDNLKPDDWYLVVSNHQSWFDILVLQRIFNRKIPLLKFFMKQELKWQFPVAAQACQVLGFPFMKRYSKDYLKKHPKMKGKDVEITRKACEKFKNIPTSIINFVEGGRFTKEKHKRQKSPFQYLLKPKAGGIAFTLETMGEYLHTLINVTIVYPNTEVHLWRFLLGKNNKVVIRVEATPIDKSLLGDYETSREFRVYFQNWLNELWKEKDALIAEIHKEDNTGKL